MAEEVINHFPQIIQALQEGAKVAVRQVASQNVLPAAQANCPVDTGATQASGYYVASDVSTYGQAVGAAEGADGTREMLPEVAPPDSETAAIVAFAAINSIYVHDGTRRMPARPFLAQAAEGARGAVAQTVADVISAAIEGAGIK